MSSPSPQRWVTVAAERLPRWLAGFTDRHGAADVSWSPAASPDVVTLVGADSATAWLEVPFAPLRAGSTEPALDALIAHVQRDRSVGVLIVRRGGHAAGLFDGVRLVASKVGSTYVQGTTKAGGWSQQRYARRRANQSDAAFAAAAEAALRVFGDSAPEHLVVGGDRDGVRAVLADRRLAPLPEPTGPWLDVKDPKRAVLEGTPARFRAVRIGLDP